MPEELKASDILPLPVSRPLVLGTLAALLLLIWLLQPILAPFLIGVALAYLGDPVVDRLEARGLSRTLGVCVVFLVLTLLSVLLLFLLVPMLVKQLALLQSSLPLIVEWLQGRAVPWVERTFDMKVDWLEPARLRELFTSGFGGAMEFWGPLVKRISQSGMAVLGWLINLGLVPVVTFYLLRDWDDLIARMRSYIPRRYEPKCVQLALECDEVISAFVRGQLLVMISLGIFYSAGLMVVGLDLALLIGMLAGLAGVVPYLGFVVGVGAATIAALIQFPDLLHVGLVLLVFGAGQALESMILTPLLVGDRIGLHPVAVIFAVLAGGQLFGVTGVLLALPVAAVLAVMFRHLKVEYLESDWYLHMNRPPGEVPGVEPAALAVTEPSAAAPAASGEPDAGRDDPPSASAPPAPKAE